MQIWRLGFFRPVGKGTYPSKKRPIPSHQTPSAPHRRPLAAFDRQSGRKWTRAPPHQYRGRPGRPPASLQPKDAPRSEGKGFLLVENSEFQPTWACDARAQRGSPEPLEGCARVGCSASSLPTAHPLAFRAAAPRSLCERGTTAVAHRTAIPAARRAPTSPHAHRRNLAHLHKRPCPRSPPPRRPP